MEEIPKPDNLAKRGGVWFRCGMHELHIGIQEDFAAKKRRIPPFMSTILEALRQHLAAKGVPIVEDEPLEGALPLLCA